MMNFSETKDDEIKWVLVKGCRCFCCFELEGGEPLQPTTRRKKMRKSLRRVKT